MNIPDRTGHSVVEWDTEEKESVAKARTVFDQLHGKGCYLAVAVDPVTKKATALRSFKPEAEQIDFIAPMAGG